MKPALNHESGDRRNSYHAAASGREGELGKEGGKTLLALLTAGTKYKIPCSILWHCTHNFFLSRSSQSTVCLSSLGSISWASPSTREGEFK